MRYLYFLAIILTFTGCDKEDFIDITDQVTFPSLFRSPCFDVFAYSEKDEFVFNEENTFKAYVDSIRIYPVNLNCDTASVPEIDFADYSLLGKYTSGGGCDVKYERKVFKDEINKRIIYEIDVKYIGTCEMLITSRNWVLIPKMPENYSFEFKVRKR